MHKSATLLTALVVFVLAQHGMGQDQKTAKQPDFVQADRPKVVQITVPDATCWGVFQDSNGALTAGWRWKSNCDNGSCRWVCDVSKTFASGMQSTLPAFSAPTAQVWTGASSDEQYKYFAYVVRDAVTAAKQDTIITQDSLRALLVELIKTQLNDPKFVRELIRAQLKDPQFVKEIADAIKAQQANISPLGENTVASGTTSKQ